MPKQGVTFTDSDTRTATPTPTSRPTGPGSYACDEYGICNIYEVSPTLRVNHRRPVFMKKREHQRAVDVLAYYRFANPPMRYSQLLSLPPLAQETIWQRIRKNPVYDVQIIAYCLMPNHFHLILKQTQEGGRLSLHGERKQ